MKHCYSCDKNKEEALFNKNKTKADGLASECKNCKKEKDRLRYAKNKSYVTKKNSLYYYNNKDYVLKRNKKYFKEYVKRNRAYLTAKEAKRRAAKLKATPLWVDKKEIEVIYSFARWLSIAAFQEYHVDHIVPLNNNKVCGLHCSDNLQILTAIDNIKKSNKICLD